MRFMICLCIVLSLIPSMSPAEDNLPNDADYISVIGPKAQALFADSAFDDLRNTCHVVQVTKDSPVFAERYGSGPYAITDENAVRVQLNDGTVVYQASGDELDTNPTIMAECFRVHLLKKIFYPWKKHKQVVVDPPKKELPKFEPVKIEKSEGKSNDADPVYVLVALLVGVLFGKFEAFCEKVEK